MNDILKDQPIPDGYTGYCGPFKSRQNSFGSLLNDPDPYNKLGRLPMPGSNLDQARIMAPTANFFGRKDSKYKKNKKKLKKLKSKNKILKKIIKSISKKSKKSKKKSKRKSKKRSFGATPGTIEWKNEWSNPTKTENILNPILGNFGNANLPMQYKDNALNSPKVSSSFGTKKKQKSKPNRKRPSLSYGTNENTVGYGPKINLYTEAATTMDFLTGKPYTNDIYGRNIGSVQNDGMTPGAWLTNSKGLSNSFGSRVQTAVGSDAGSGHITLNSPSFNNLGGKTISLNKGVISIS